MTRREANDVLSNRRCTYYVGFLAWLAVLPLLPSWVAAATCLAPAPWLARRVYRAGQRIRIPFLDRQERSA